MTILPNPQIVIVSFQAPEFFPLAVLPPDNSHMEMKCDLKWMCTCLSLLFPFFILFIFIFFFGQASDDRLFSERFSQENAQQTNQNPAVRHRKSEGGKWRKHPIGLQLLSVCRDDVICFHKTRFKFVPASPELQRRASVETSADYISGVRECALHQNPTNSKGEPCPP